MISEKMFFQTDIANEYLKEESTAVIRTQFSKLLEKLWEDRPNNKLLISVMNADLEYYTESKKVIWK